MTTEQQTEVADSLTFWFHQRYLIYLTSLILWVLLEYEFAASFGPSLSSREAEWTFFVPFTIGALLFSVNCLLTFHRRTDQAREEDLDNQDRLKEERTRIGLVQQYGANLLVATSVVAAITGIQKDFVSLAYLGASIISGITAIVPIWMGQHDWRPLNLLRHVKTALLVFSVSWLAQAILVLLSTGLG